MQDQAHIGILSPSGEDATLFNLPEQSSNHAGGRKNWCRFFLCTVLQELLGHQKGHTCSLQPVPLTQSSSPPTIPHYRYHIVCQSKKTLQLHMGLRDCPGGNSGSLCWIHLDEWQGVVVLDGNAILPSIVNAGPWSLFSSKKPASWRRWGTDYDRKFNSPYGWGCAQEQIDGLIIWSVRGQWVGLCLAEHLTVTVIFLWYTTKSWTQADWNGVMWMARWDRPAGMMPPTTMSNTPCIRSQQTTGHYSTKERTKHAYRE